MANKAQRRCCPRAFFLLLLSAAVICRPPHKAQAQTTPNQPRYRANVNGEQSGPNIYEDDEINLRIPEDWAVITIPDQTKHGMAGAFGFLAGSFVFAKRSLLLEKDGYILALAYNTGHASCCGRFEEVFKIPWIPKEDLAECSFQLSSSPLPASRTLLFYNLVIDTGLPEARQSCGIQKDLVYRTDGKIAGERRWLGGLFTTAYEAWFFPSAGDGCGLKAYALVSQAATPEQMPNEGDPKLKTIIQQAIDLVDSIHYKRCPPSTER
jgi:hypothetical protein